MKIFDWFKPKPKRLQLTGFVYEAWQHNGWGDNMHWFEWEPDENDQRKLVGWLYRIPDVGDEVRFKAKSGKIMRFAVVSVERMGNPRDMFFANCIDVGYVGDIADEAVVEAEKQVIEEDTKEEFKFL